MKKVITFGEVMLRLATPGYERFGQSPVLGATFGGGEANVAVSVANYGIPVSYITRLPVNDIARACLQELRGLGVDICNCISGGSRMGIYFLETGAVNRSGKVIYDREHSAMAELEHGMIEWKRILKGADWFHFSGITPAISQGAADACLEAVKTAKDLGITISVDLNYRKNLWKYGKTAKEVMTRLAGYCDIIFGNEEDAGMSFGFKPEGVDIKKGKLVTDAYLSVSQQIMHQFPECKKVITSLRGSVSASHNTWSGVLYDGKKLYTAPVYQITHIVDRVGAGDAFMGGLIYGMITFKDDQKALNFAVAASCLKHTIHGDYNRVTVAEVEKLMEGDSSGRVSR